MSLTFSIYVALTVRSFSIQLSKQAEAVTDNTPPSIDPTLTKKITEEQAAELVDILKEQHKLGDLKGAIKAVQAANKLGYATKESYITLLNVLRDSPFDVESCAIVANWFYSPDSNIRSETLNDIEVWKGVLKLGLRFGSTYRSEDLRALVDRFQQIFDLNTLNDEAWGLLVRVNIQRIFFKEQCCIDVLLGIWYFEETRRNYCFIK